MGAELEGLCGVTVAPRTAAVAGLFTGVTGETVVGVEVVPVAATAARGTGFGSVSVDGADETVVGSLMTVPAGVTAAATEDWNAVAVSAGREPVAVEFWPWRDWRRWYRSAL